MAEMIVGLSKSNTQMKTTLRYLDQIQRSTDRLNRVRYQGLIKVNNELRMTGRRLESIYSTAVRLSRLRITPTIGLNDQATPVLHGLIGKMKQIRSKLLHATAKVQFKVRHQISGVSVNVNSQPLMDALNTNTISILKLSAKLDSLNIAAGGKEEKPKTFLQKMKGMFDRGKSISSGVGKVFDARNSGKKLWKEITTPATPGNKLKKAFKVTKRGAAFVNDFSSAGSDLIGGFDGLWGDVKGLFGGGGSGSGAGGSGGSGIISKLGGNLVKGAGKLFAPLRMYNNIKELASAPPEDRARAVGSVAGNAVGTAIGTVLGSVIPIPVVGNMLGGSIGGWLGEKAGGWLGDKVGGFLKNNAEDISKVAKFASEGASFVAEKTTNLFNGVAGFFGFGSKKEEQTAPAAAVITSPSTPVATQTPPPPPIAPQMPPPYRPAVLSITGPEAYMNNRFGSPTAAGLMGTSVMQSQAVAMNNAGQPNEKASPLTVRISEEQMSSLAGYLKDFKTETTNQIAVNIAPGTVQVTVRENAIDYDAVSHQVGQRISNEFRRAMQNRKTIMA
ncbi:hypothetical protein MKY66_06290 [Paenibacillus sp. FSL R5-0766]|uniref:hypothetical protein n=1 Tax=unclassified Paenibacillus TaxID=185978 RepID=UPI00096F634F|nr:hypothetical protein [Paenibacillus sp. FSL R5-0765]OMF66291.1 hypothetical protein BK141_05020 [Paenibacillus sp. FSL R5-0765]